MDLLLLLVPVIAYHYVLLANGQQGIDSALIEAPIMYHYQLSMPCEATVFTI